MSVTDPNNKGTQNSKTSLKATRLFVDQNSKWSKVSLTNVIQS